MQPVLRTDTSLLPTPRGSADIWERLRPKPPKRYRLGREPVLDGLRGLAVVLVLLFHGGFEWARGGYLGVSMFFTLSGFLITSLLVAEYQGEGRVDVREFWSRRFRRLVPAALLGLGVAIVYVVLAGTEDQAASLPGDVVSSAAYVANWHFLADGRSYAELFQAPSPLQHYWSLAIEEQFYIVLPLLLLGVLHLARRWSPGPPTSLVTRRGALRMLLATLVGLTALSFGVGLLVDGDRLYYGTDTRAAELLLGAALAVFLLLRPPSPSTSKFTARLAIPALLGLLALASMLGYPNSFLTRGGFIVVAGITALVVAGGAGPGPVRSLLSTRPLQALGSLSYGLYLFHWPVFLWLSPGRTGLPLWPLFGLRLAATLALAWASYLIIERPLRTSLVLRPGQGLALTGVAVVLAVSTAQIVSVRAADPAIDFEAVADLPAPPPPPDPSATTSTAVDAGTEPTIEPTPRATTGTTLFEPTTTTEPPPAPAPRPLRLLVVGDSTSLTVGFGSYVWGQESGSLVVSNGGISLCGIVVFDRVRWLDGWESPRNPTCAKRDDLWRQALDEFQPDAILVVASPVDTSDLKVDGSGDWVTVADDTGAEAWWRDASAAVDLLSSTGRPIIWATVPYIEMSDPTSGLPSYNSLPERTDALNELVAELDEARDEVVRLEYAERLNRPGREIDRAIRPDGVHVSNDAAIRLARDWLEADVLAAYEQATGRPVRD